MIVLYNLYSLLILNITNIQSNHYIHTSTSMHIYIYITIMLRYTQHLLKHTFTIFP
jgi:hypothetical protein